MYICNRFSTERGMKDSFDLTVIIPVYNREAYLLRTLRSVAAQQERNFRLIIVDNNSADKSVEIAQEFKRENESADFVVDLISCKTPGAAAARNAGLELAETEWVYFFDSDDVMLPDLVKRFRTVKACVDADVVFLKIRHNNPDSGSYEIAPPTGKYLENHILHGSMRTMGYLVKRGFVNSCGGWDNSVLGWNDWELGMRLLAANPKIAEIKGIPLVDYFLHSDSITGTDFSSKLNTWLHSIDCSENDIRNSSVRDKEKMLLLLEYKRIMLAAQCKKEKSDKGETLYAEVLERIPRRLRWAFRLTYFHISTGLRGGSHIANAAVKLLG